MHWHNLDGRDWVKSIGVGIGVSIITAAFMLAAATLGASPLPKALGLAFAETALARPLPLPVGLLFHTAWTTAFSVLYVALFRDALTFMRAFWLAFALWILALVFFFPARRLGLFRTGGQPETDCWRGNPAPLVRRVSMGPVSLGIYRSQTGVSIISTNNVEPHFE